MRLTIPRLSTSLGFSLAAILSLAASLTQSSAAVAQATYPSADAAVAALVDAVRSADPAASIVEVLGPDGAEIADSGDPVADVARRERFIAAFDEVHQVQQQDAAKAILSIGKDEYPFPIPLVQEDGKWRWDTAAGLEEILTRRVGENELSTIKVMRAFVDAQNEYASRERDGTGIQFARRLMSREGRKDGLYWPVSDGEEASPMGPLVAEAQREGYKRSGSDTAPPNYHGYVYRLLYAQGANAPGGAIDYIVNNRMIGGFGLIATPADYGNSGVMTFIVNQDGEVYEKDLGSEGANRIKLFDPDPSWKKVAAE